MVRAKIFRRTVITLTILMVFAMVFAMALCSLWLWGPVSQNYMPTQFEKHGVTLIGRTLHVTRAFKITRPLTIMITREAISRDPASGAYIRYALPSQEITYDTPGEYTVTRLYGIPDSLPTGRYKLMNSVTWQANPLREQTVRLPVLDFEVK